MKKLVTAILFSLGVLAQAQPLKWQDRRFMVDECGIRYNGVQLPLGQDTMEWVRVLGPPDRRLATWYFNMGQRDIRYLVWDSHGLALKYGQVKDTMWLQSAIFFLMGLDSEEGRKLTLTSTEDYAIRYKPLSKSREAELRAHEGDSSFAQARFPTDPRNFPYPATPVRSQVRLDGLLLNPYISWDSLNGMRSAMGQPPFKEELLFGDYQAKLKAYYQPRKPGTPTPQTISGIYTLVSPRLCQGISYFWVLRYSDFGRLVHLRISTQRPWENAQKLKSQLRSDQTKVDRIIGYKDGYRLWYRIKRYYDGNGRLKRYKDGKKPWL
jgi:hypothetical protein